MAVKDYGFPMRIPPEQLESLDFIVEALTCVRDEFYKERGIPVPKKPMSRQEALRESLWLSEMVSRGRTIAVTVEDIKNGEFLKSDNLLTECLRNISMLSTLGLARHLGHEIHVEKDAAGVVTHIEIDGKTLEKDVIDREAKIVLEELAPEAH